jgi:hypothetical protein
MRTYLIPFIILFYFIPGISNYYASDKHDKSVKNVYNVYRRYEGKKDGMKIWIVDGPLIRSKIFNEFLYGGNNARYPFVPAGEIWIDNSISAEEYLYTLAHELNEYKLMTRSGASYSNAHNSSLALELKMRNEDEIKARLHEKETGKVSVYDCDSIKQIASFPDSIFLNNIYLQKYDSLEGVSVWIVNGSEVRKQIYPDFGFSGSDLAYRFIPTGEIWIDAQVSCEETGFSISSELEERKLMSSGRGYDEAYTGAILKVSHLRKAQSFLSKKQIPARVTPQLYREMVPARSE